MNDVLIAEKLIEGHHGKEEPENGSLLGYSLRISRALVAAEVIIKDLSRPHLSRKATHILDDFGDAAIVWLSKHAGEETNA